MGQNPSLDDMRVFSLVVELGSFTAAGQRLGMPKQTVSRRVAALEAGLGVPLLTRSTRRITPTPAGEVYARRCAQLVRFAADSNRAVVDQGVPSGRLRITADPHFGELFLSELIVAFAKEWPDLIVESEFTQRKVDLVGEGFDLAFRVGRIVDETLVARSLGPARMTYCASPAYLRRHRPPATPWELDRHRCILLAPQPGPAQWFFAGSDGAFALNVKGHFRTNQPALARRAAREGLGIVNLPEFYCVGDVTSGALVPVLAQRVGDHGQIFAALPGPLATAPPRVSLFLARVDEAFADSPPWEVGPRDPRQGI